MTTFELTGLKGHHPLGFLAACGLLRCCSEPFAATRLAWNAQRVDSAFHAVLHSDSRIDTTMLTQVLTCRAKQQRQSTALTWSAKIDDRGKFRETARRVCQAHQCADTRDSLATFAALASDVVTRRNGDLRPTLLDLTSGNQGFLTSMRVVAGEPKQRNGNLRSFAENAVQEAVLGPWLYGDDDHSLGWDPQIQRLHALRHKVPEQDKANRSVRVALFLASQALPLFPCFAVDGQLRTVCFRREGREDSFYWPIWDRPISIDVLKSLVAQVPSGNLAERGVVAVYRSLRASTGGTKGDYRIFSHPERVW